MIENFSGHDIRYCRAFQYFENKKRQSAAGKSEDYAVTAGRNALPSKCHTAR